MPAVSAAACCAAATPANEVVEDLFGFLRVLSDGTILRSPAEPVFCPTTFPTSHPSVQWKEAVYDKARNLRVRMYKPATSADGDAAENKLPVLVHFHGGGFCLGSCTWGNVHAFCLRLAADAGAVVLSAGYRLAPEHRLPAAFDDGASFMRWLREQAVNAEAEADAWLTEAADFGRVFVTGDSAGGTIAHHLAVRAGSATAEPGETTADPVTVRGHVLMMPFFGGVRRTPSEAGCPAEAFPNLDLVDRFWRLSLPPGATRDHPASNPFGPDSPDLGSVDLRPVLVVAGGLDLIRDRTVDYAERLAAMGKTVELAEFAGKAHGFYLHEPGSEATGELIQAVVRFVDGCVAATEAAA
ncbi:putative carboxylesterase 15 [Panicum miliaceum]|uniref:Carboxylesterase 15 n=1 Tax=Panicum miliaceum TaxID=4540 RepID=A0A3L6QNF4_PANMI|nr:putative carboxylesterase 15 [Panicum miliaceum]